MPLSEQRGGGELMFWHLMLHGRGKGMDFVAVFFGEGPLVEQTRELGITVYVVQAGRMRELHRMGKAIGEITGIIRREGVGLVVGWMGTAQLYGGPAAKRAGVPNLWYQLGIPLDKSLLDRIAAALPANAILTLSKAGREAQRGVSSKRPLGLVYPGVELENYDPAALPSREEARRKVGIPPDGPLIGIVGRLQKWKGMHVLVDAMPLIQKRYPDARCVIVGGQHAAEPEYEGIVAQQIKEKGLSERVTMVGLQKNVPEWMQAMDVIVHASDHEPFGMVVIEAMALEKPVIAGDAAGPTEIITPEENGLLAPYGDPEKIAAAILRYLDDPAFAVRVGKAARTRALDFTAQKYADNLVAAFKELAGLPA